MEKESDREEAVNSAVQLAIGEVLDKLTPPQVKSFESDEACNKWLAENAGQIMIEGIEYRPLAFKPNNANPVTHCYGVVYNESPKLSKERLNEELRGELQKIVDNMIKKNIDA